MLISKEDGQYKYICPTCGGDNIGESGLGGKLVHCFGICMSDIPKTDCNTVQVTDPKELEALKQPPY